MKKRYIALAMGLVTAVSITAAVFAADKIKDIKAQLRPDFTVKIDGVEKVFRNVDGDVVYPLLHDGTTYLPIRAIGEIMGKKVYWYEDDKRIELKEEKSTVTDADVIVSGSSDKKEKHSEKPKDNKDKTPDSNLITAAQAKKAALEKADVSESKVQRYKYELDYDDGLYRYEIEFYADGYDYDIDVSAHDGKILSFDKEKDSIFD